MRPGLRPWQPGQSGNPSGRAKLTREQELAIRRARKLCPKAMLELARMLRDVDLEPRVKIQAIQVVLDRGLGKPVQQIDLTTEERPPLEDMSPAERVRVLRVALEEQEQLAAAELATAGGVN